VSEEFGEEQHGQRVTSGAASAFGIFRLPPGRHWWQGEPINPHPVFTED
jgi:hypothetical protein